MASSITVQKGTKFHSVYADGNPEWVVVSKAGRDAWRCKVTDDRDYYDVVKLFSTAEIRRSLAMAAAFDSMDKAKDDFFESTPLGTTIHYHNGFGEFVRGIVVKSVLPNSNGREVKCLKPVALVGAWKPFDLPRRNVDGTVNLGYHVQKILEERCWVPSVTCIYEADERLRQAQKDPRDMPELDLSVPDMTPEEVSRAKLEQTRQRIAQALEVEDPAEAIRLVQEILGA